MVHLDITLGNYNIIEHNMVVSVEEAQEDLSFRIASRESNSLYTLVIYDPDAPYPENPIASPYLHYLEINIGSQEKRSNVLASYLPPNPPPDSKPHRYLILLYRQNKIISLDKNYFPEERSNFPLEAFIRENKLKLVVGTLFRSGYFR